MHTLFKDVIVVIVVSDGESACEKFFSDEFNLVLLDLMLPKRNGMEVMRKIRESSTVPIIIISAKDTDSDKTLGLGLGADDYITKPFSVTEVLARIKANIRRTTQYAAGASMRQPVLKKGALTMDLNAYSVKKDGKEIELTAKEFGALVLSKLAIYLCIFMGSKYMRSSFVIDFIFADFSYSGKRR